MIPSSSYAFRSTEKVALQEIGPRFTLKLRSLKKGLPAVNYLGDVAKPLEFDDFGELEEKTEIPVEDQGETGDSEVTAEAVKSFRRVPPKADEYEWVWKVSFGCDSERSSLMHPSPSRSSRHRGVHFFCELCSNSSVHVTGPPETMFISWWASNLCYLLTIRLCSSLSETVSRPIPISGAYKGPCT